VPAAALKTKRVPRRHPPVPGAPVPPPPRHRDHPHPGPPPRVHPRLQGHDPGGARPHHPPHPHAPRAAQLRPAHPHPPLDGPAGPIDATVFAPSTRPEVELEATLEDVAPGGASVPITSGPLLGSFRKLDRANSWFAADGRPLIPYHPYTRASVKPVPTGAVTRF